MFKLSRQLIGLVVLTLALNVSALAYAQDDAPPFLGILFAPDGVSGVVIDEVVEGGPAAAAGLQVGDVLLSVDETYISTETLMGTLTGYSVGDTITVGVVRDGALLTLDVTLGERPPEPTLEAPAATEEAPDEDDAPTTRPVIGVSVAEAEGGGVAVVAVGANSPADAAGIEAGDVMTAVDGESVADVQALINLLNANYRPGDTVTVTVERDGEAQTVEVTLGEAPALPVNELLQVPIGVVNYDAELQAWTVDGDGLDEFGLLDGDLITEVNGQVITNRAQLFDALSAGVLDQTITLTVERDGDTLQVDVPVIVIAAMVNTVDIPPFEVP